METVSAGATYFVSRHHEPPPATLDELLRASAKRDSVGAKTDESDSDYQSEEEDGSADELDDGEPELDEWQLHATEPCEDLYLHEMRRQRSRMDDGETQWVRGYMKAQRAWKARTGHSIDEFRIPGSIRRRKQARMAKKKRHNRSVTRNQEEDTSTSLFFGVTRVESLLLLAALLFVCLSLGVQLYVSMVDEEQVLAE